VEPRQDVEVRCRFDGTWVRGFQVAESTEVSGEPRFRLIRLSDGVVLPELFGLHDLRPRAAADGVVAMPRRRAPAPVGVGDS
jgi:hypothetical protein